MSSEPALAQVILGGALGDSLGLPSERLSRSRIAAMFPGPLRQRFVLGRGMISDDTEHTILVAQSLIEHPDDEHAFQTALARRLRWWLLGLPAGIGLATLKAIIRLWCGVPAARSGIHSAGNGPAMRSAIIGAFFSRDPERLERFVTASTMLTHTDPKARIAACAVAIAAAWASTHKLDADIGPLIDRIVALDGTDADWSRRLGILRECHAQGRSVQAYAESFGCPDRVSGYAYESVPLALYAWARHSGDAEATIGACIGCGGDTDTVAAIAGALAGASGATMPTRHLDRLIGWPLTVARMRTIGDTLDAVRHDGTPRSPVRWPWIGCLLRNPFFLVVVIVHGFRRLLPPFGASGPTAIAESGP